jgi:protein TonB
MSNLSIFEKKWLDLVFEGKNHEYGAYKLRQDSTKTTIIAFFSGILFIGLVSGMGMLFSSFGAKKVECPIPPIIDTVIKVENYTEPVINEPKPIQPITNNSAPREKVPNNQNYVVANTDVATADIPKNDELPKDNQPTGSENGTGTNTLSTNSGGSNLGTIEKNETPKGPVGTAVLDEQPDFPGGIDKFRQQVGNKFNAPEIDEKIIITVMVSFIIEKDGTMTDIKVIRNPGYGLDLEAIRVLKSIKTKWKAGKINGESVRTQYNLPIKVQTN